MMDRPFIIYHANCYDGFTAAWIAGLALGDCEFHPATYGQVPPSVRGRVVFVIDFSYQRHLMVEMAEEAESFHVLDHHKTAEAECSGLTFCEFDMERSGCGMAWDHFFGGERPAWINRVEDRDLWRFLYDDTADVHAFIASLPMNMDNWDMLNKMELSDISCQGKAIRRYIETFIGKAVKEARLVCFNNDCVVVLNIPYQNASETAGYLLKNYPEADYAMGYFQRGDGRWQYSLRSRSEFDVSEVAKQYGGGGHAQAAGFDTATLVLPR